MVVKEEGLKLIFQPSYSPELNPVEGAIKEIRRQVEGRVYGDIGSKVEAVEAVLEEMAREPERVKRLVGWGWIKEARSQLPTKI